MNADNHYGMTVNNQEEADFFLNNLKPTDNVLEWGSGASTKTIAARVGHICSIEHNPEYFESIIKENIPHAHICLVEPNAQPGPGEDGSYDEFRDYVNKARELSEKYGKFDVIFIDGRARLACASICSMIGHAGTRVFVHDYDHPKEEYKRREYLPMEKHFLNREEGVFTMWRFNIKGFEAERIAAAGDQNREG